jgi:AMP phosphorylase
LKGGVLNFNETYRVIKDIVDHRLNELEVTFFIAPSFNEKNIDLDEVYYMTKSIAMLGDTFDFGEIVADKHSTGGLPGNRMTPVIIPIVSSFGICIPKTSSRSITSPAGTADAVETIMKVDFTTEQIKEIVNKNKACLV